MKFIKDNFLLENEISKKLYSYASKMPIIDYHCHLDQEKIAHDSSFNDIGELWLSGDHYKWRLMRSGGMDEKLITERTDELARFKGFADTLSLVEEVGFPDELIMNYWPEQFFKYFQRPF